MMGNVTVVIPDLHFGNIASVVNMLRKCGVHAELISKPEMLSGADKIILSGVGAFDAGMQALNEGGWVEPLTRLAAEGRVPILGICLGMQLMCNSSEEGWLPGLGWFDADVRRFCFPAGSILKIPHMGWNTISVTKSNGLIAMGSEEQRFYFVHSYHVVCRHAEDVLASTNHGGEVTAAVHRKNLYGVQFHPEKSHRFGMALLKRFIDF